MMKSSQKRRKVLQRSSLRHKKRSQTLLHLQRKRRTLRQSKKQMQIQPNSQLKQTLSQTLQNCQQYYQKVSLNLIIFFTNLRHMDHRGQLLLAYLLQVPSRWHIPYAQRKRLLQLLILTPNSSINTASAFHILSNEFGIDTAPRRTLIRFLQSLRRQLKASFYHNGHRLGEWVATFQHFAPMRRLWQYLRMDSPCPFFPQSWLASLAQDLRNGQANLQTDLSVFEGFPEGEKSQVLLALTQLVFAAGKSLSERMEIQFH